MRTNTAPIQLYKSPTKTSGESKIGRPVIQLILYNAANNKPIVIGNKI